MAKSGDIGTKTLLVALNITTGIAIWFAYTFANHVTHQLDIHEARIDKLEQLTGLKKDGKECGLPSGAELRASQEDFLEVALQVSPWPKQPPI